MTTFFFALLISITDFGQQKNPDVGAPPNNVSRGQSDEAGISESPAGTSRKERQQYRNRAGSMGGAPNLGAGMSTGTGVKTKALKNPEIKNED